MGQDSERAGKRGDLQFFGAVTASVTHELNNVISIIDQVAGLLADHLAALRAGRPIDPERLEEMEARIVRQTARGVSTIKRLNAFAHTVDEPCTHFSPAAVLGNLAALCERLVTLRRATLAVELPVETVCVEGDPFALQQSMFCALQEFLPSVKNGDRLLLIASAADDQVTLQITGRRSGGAPDAVEPAPAAGDAARWSGPLDAAVAAMGGSIVRQETTSDAGPAMCLTITLPFRGV